MYFSNICGTAHLCDLQNIKLFCPLPTTLYYFELHLLVLNTGPSSPRGLL